ncbi:MAG: metallophosphoesterase [Candidatus Eiseniibacteriota bacterium]
MPSRGRPPAGRTIGLIAALIVTVVCAHPARAADEIHWTITGPGSVTFDWRGPENVVHFGRLNHDLLLTAIATPASPVPVSSPGPFWEARITGLQPGSLYYYTVGSGAMHTFRTAPPAGASNFKVCVAGDIGNATSFMRMGVIQTMIAGEQPNLVLMVGDLTYGNILTEADVDRHFNDVMSWSQDAAYMPAWGNHEWDQTTDDLRNYKGRFDFPNAHSSPTAPDSADVAGALPPYGEDWYWFDYGNARFIAIPDPYTYGVGGPWANWFANVAAVMDQAQNDPSIAFIVTFGHRPVYTSGNYSPGDLTLRAYLDGLGGTYGKYVLDLCGHSHDYERSLPQANVTHITAGTGGAPLENTKVPACLWKSGCPAPAWSAYRAMHHAVVTLRFTPVAIEGRVLCGPPGDTTNTLNDITCVQGSVIDSFTIRNPAVLAAMPPAELEFGIDPVRPNPALGEFRLSYRLAGFAPATLDLLDAAGRLLATRRVGSLGPGTHQARFDASQAPPGVYFVRLRQAGRMATSRITLLASGTR